MKITIDHLQHKQIWDVVQVHVNYNFQDQDISTYCWSNCNFYFCHCSDFWWPELYAELIHWPYWPTDGSDYSFFFPTYNYHPSIRDELKIVELNTISYISSMAERKMKIHIPSLNTDYTFVFTNDEIIKKLFETIINNVHCFQYHPMTNWENGEFIIYNTNLA